MSVRLPIFDDSPDPHDGPGPADAAADPMLAAIHAGDAPTVARLARDAPRDLHRHRPLAVPNSDPPREEMWLPLHHAAALGDPAIVALLLDAGAHPDARTRAATPDHARATALHLAAAVGKPAIVRLLLDADADPNVLDAHQTTPLIAAADHPEVARMLRESGADPQAGKQ